MKTKQKLLRVELINKDVREFRVEPSALQSRCKAAVSVLEVICRHCLDAW